MVESIPEKANHTLSRKQCIARARPTDNAGRFVATFDPHFDLSRTIFKSLPKGYKTLFQRTKLDSVYTWEEAAAAEIEEAFAKVPVPVHDNSALYRFMHEECDFSIEHADGSFMDHLHFCQDYTAVNFPSASPRVMLLHSILGVGTNCFPMQLAKLPALEALVTPAEMAHINAFPSALRLLVHGPLLQDLARADAAQLASLKALRYHRLLDNAELELSADQLWEQLNFQLVHALDFLPVAAWKRTSGSDYFFQIFIQLHAILTRAGKLQAKVDWDPAWMLPLAPGARPNTWRHWLVDMLPAAVLMKLAKKQIHRYSTEVGHSLDYQLTWQDTPSSRL